MASAASAVTLVKEMSPAALESLIKAGTGSESKLAPPTWQAPLRETVGATLISGIEAVDLYRSLTPVTKVFEQTRGAIPGWAKSIAKVGGLWQPMALEARALVATVEASANKMFKEVSANVKKAAALAPLIGIGLDVASQVMALTKAVDVKTIMSAVTGLLKNALDIVSTVSKAFNVAKDALACVPYLGMVASLITTGIQMALQYFPGKDIPGAIENFRLADEDALKSVEAYCKQTAETDARPYPTGRDKDGKPTVTPSDMFRPVSYWIQRCVDFYVKGQGSYRTVYGDRGMSYEPKYPAPPMTPSYFYLALCGDVLPPILRVTTCGVNSYKPGFLAGGRVYRDIFDCYTVAVNMARSGQGPWKGAPNPDFGIPRKTRQLMWRLLQTILGGVKSPALSGFQGSDDGFAFYSTLQQIVFNEYLANRIDEKLIGYLNGDMAMRHGHTDVSDLKLVIRKNDKGSPFEGRATCYDHGIDISGSFWQGLQQFQADATERATVEGKPFYDKFKETWNFDASLMKAARKEPAKGVLVLGEDAEKAITSGLKGETKDRMAEGAVPWSTLLVAGGLGFGAWMYTRSKARGGK